MPQLSIEIDEQVKTVIKYAASWSGQPQKELVAKAAYQVATGILKEKGYMNMAIELIEGQGIDFKSFNELFPNSKPTKIKLENGDVEDPLIAKAKVT